MNSTHTPGPWFVRETDETGAMVVGSNLDPVADTHGHNNTRLIATAPDLLAALEWLADSDEVDRPEALSVIRAAIAKAKGLD